MEEFTKRDFIPAKPTAEEVDLSKRNTLVRIAAGAGAIATLEIPATVAINTITEGADKNLEFRKRLSQTVSNFDPNGLDIKRDLTRIMAKLASEMAEMQQLGALAEESELPVYRKELLELQVSATQVLANYLSLMEQKLSERADKSKLPPLSEGEFVEI